MNPIAADTLTVEQNDGQIMMNLEEMMKSRYKSLQEMLVERKKFKEMYDDGFVNNPVYRENAEKAKEALKVKATTKQQIASQPSMVATANKIKDLNRDIKERKLALSDYALEYERLTGADCIEIESGKMLTIVKSAKLVNMASKK